MTQNETLKKVSQFILLVFFASTLAVTFNNCSGEDVGSSGPSDDIVSKLPIEEIQVLQAPTGEADPELCEVRSFACIKRIYQPGLAAGEALDEFCDTGGECLDVHIVTYDSAQALSHCEDCTEADGEPGGRYHYEEHYCFNESIRERIGTEVRTYASSLEAAVEQATALCKEQLEL